MRDPLRNESKIGGKSGWRFWGWKGEGNNFRLKSLHFMRAIAERLVLAETASAERDERAAGEIELVAVMIEYLEVVFHTKASIVSYGDLGGHDDPLF